MKFFAIIFFLGALQSIRCDILESAIQSGNERISALKAKWESEIPEIESVILPELDEIASGFAEAADQIFKEVKNDATKLQKSQDVNAAYNSFIDTAKQAIKELANVRPNVLEKFFQGKELSSTGYEQVSEIWMQLKGNTEGESCKEIIFDSFAKVAKHQIDQITGCVIKGGSNFPALPNAVRSIRATTKKITKDTVMAFQRCPYEPNTDCFDERITVLKDAQQIIKENVENYRNNPPEEIIFQKTISQKCINRVTNMLKSQVNDFKNDIAKCQ